MNQVSNNLALQRMWLIQLVIRLLAYLSDFNQLVLNSLKAKLVDEDIQIKSLFSNLLSKRPTIKNRRKSNIYCA